MEVVLGYLFAACLVVVFVTGVASFFYRFKAQASLKRSFIHKYIVATFLFPSIEKTDANRKLVETSNKLRNILLFAVLGFIVFFSLFINTR